MERSCSSLIRTSQLVGVSVSFYADSAVPIGARDLAGVADALVASGRIESSPVVYNHSLHLVTPAARKLLQVTQRILRTLT